jgi:hypothetical protein
MSGGRYPSRRCTGMLPMELDARRQVFEKCAVDCSIGGALAISIRNPLVSYGVVVERVACAASERLELPNRKRKSNLLRDICVIALGYLFYCSKQLSLFLNIG